MSVPEPFAWAWGNMRAFTQEALCGPHESLQAERSKVSLHDFARNDLVARMRGDWILMLDTDIIFEPDLCARMVSMMYRRDLDVLTGIYSFKVPPHYPVLYMYNHESEKNEVVADWDKNAELLRVDSAGAGCLLVRRRAFERIAKELGENPFDRIGRKGEDHSFFDRLRKLAIPLWCAPSIEVQHLEYFGVQTSLHFNPVREPDHFFEHLGLDRQVVGAA